MLTEPLIVITCRIDSPYRLISRSTFSASASPQLMIEVSIMFHHVSDPIGFIEVANIENDQVVKKGALRFPG